MTVVMMMVLMVVVGWYLTFTECLLQSCSKYIHTETYSILTVIPQGRHDYYSHFTHVEATVILRDVSDDCRPRAQI